MKSPFMRTLLILLIAALALASAGALAPADSAKAAPVAAAKAAAATAKAVTCDRARVLACGFKYLDSNNDGVLTAAEINAFMVSQPCGVMSTIVSGETFLSNCDRNKDGVFNVTDYDAPLSCFQSNGVRSSVCRQCDKCDAAFPNGYPPPPSPFKRSA